MPRHYSYQKSEEVLVKLEISQVITKAKICLKVKWRINKTFDKRMPIKFDSLQDISYYHGPAYALYHLNNYSNHWD